MSTTVKTDGQQTATIGTEHTLATITDPGVFIPCVDIAALVSTDVVEIRVYGKVRSGGTERLLTRGTYGPGPVASPFVQSVPITSPHYLRFTLKQTAGTGRAFPWAIYQA